MPANPITTRLPEWLEEELNGTFAASGEGRSEGMRRIAEEWWTLEHFPAIEFRDGVTGRRASVRGGPDVWEIAMVERDYSNDREGLYEHFSWIPREHLDQALAYAGKFASEVHGRVELNERIGRQMEAACNARARKAG
ncbi:hypothetical protein [Longimicrobium sp.]|uniref:hypothetical protein n=1 Tax=Longimicrobium sp. TaxID=2029185 RepID=UPI002C6687DB|nr:hypothetical protein [Longimicrobium sp.]HSU15656.1 hypothetical protein [Longimicrobium sp.]